MLYSGDVYRKDLQDTVRTFAGCSVSERCQNALCFETQLRKDGEVLLKPLPVDRPVKGLCSTLYV